MKLESEKGTMILSFYRCETPGRDADFFAKNLLETHLHLEDGPEGNILAERDLSPTLIPDWRSLLKAMADLSRSPQRSVEETCFPFKDSELLISLRKEGELRPFGIRFVFLTLSGNPDPDLPEIEAFFGPAEWEGLRASWQKELGGYPVLGHHVTRPYCPPEKRFSIPTNAPWNPKTPKRWGIVTVVIAVPFLAIEVSWGNYAALGAAVLGMLSFLLFLLLYLHRVRKENRALLERFLDQSSEAPIPVDASAVGYESPFGYGLLFAREGLWFEGDERPFPYSALRMEIWRNSRLPGWRLGFVLDIESGAFGEAEEEGWTLECPLTPELASFLDKQEILPGIPDRLQSFRSRKDAH